jgi:hypothetical protein
MRYGSPDLVRKLFLVRVGRGLVLKFNAWRNAKGNGKF